MQHGAFRISKFPSPALPIGDEFFHARVQALLDGVQSRCPESACMSRYLRGFEDSFSASGQSELLSAGEVADTWLSARPVPPSKSALIEFCDDQNQ